MSMKPKEVMCAKCEDGEVAQRLVRELGWTYSRLALDGLRTVVFDGPSPTYCIASGNVWLDHPCMEKVGCLTHTQVRSIATSDKQRNVTLFDWDSYYLAGDQICLRFGKVGFRAVQCLN